MVKTIFYSWQSDVPQNRTFVRSALDKALRELAQEADVEEAKRDLTADQDTQGLPGSPPIADTILSKIARSYALLADLTYVADRPVGGKVPNPNVMLEYGYALHALGDSHIIAVQNDVCGVPADLPFDLAHKRWPIRFHLESVCAEKAAERDKLTAALKSAIKLLPPVEGSIIDSLQLAKRYCRDDALALEWSELLAVEVNIIRGYIENSWPSDTPEAGTINAQFAIVSDLTSNFRKIMLLCGRWGTQGAVNECLSAIRTLSFSNRSTSGFNTWIAMRELPAILSFYWLLAGAIARDELERAKTILGASVSITKKNRPFVTEFIFAQDDIPWESLNDAGKRYFPQSQWASSLMASDASVIGLSDEQSRELYLDTEHLVMLEFGHHRLQEVKSSGLWFWAPGGDFLWDTSSRRFADLAKDGYDALISAGLLGGNTSSASESLGALRDFMKKQRGFLNLAI